MSPTPQMKDLVSRLLRAPGVDEWLDGEMFARMPPDAVTTMGTKLGCPMYTPNPARSFPDDALMYLRLNVTRWRAGDYAALAWNEILDMDLADGRLPLLRRDDGTLVGVVTSVPKGRHGHVARWSGERIDALRPDTWEDLFRDLVEKVEAGALAPKPLRIRVEL